MEKQPIKVQLVGKNKDRYQIKFPNLEIPVEVNKHLYNKMLYSDQYQFRNVTRGVKKAYAS
ncbi:hypothetical protein [Aquimarina sp. SS2-1]|uniref:hypothetical protein n=1 Tax=Aquimarina besae TaxID=3342247 RepID=UPI00366D2E6E